jgi:CMP-N,N'-diacetyllegionaminic acid synthase
MKILVVVAARAGSKRVKNKNIRNLAGKPLIAHTINQVVRWGKYAKFVFSTDSLKMAAIAKRYGAEVPFMRPAVLASDKAGKVGVIRHALLEAEKIYRMKFDAVLDLDATNPIRTVKDIDNIVSIFKKHKPDCVFSVVKARKNPYFNMVEIDKKGRARLCKKASRVIRRSQDAPKVYDMNASMYVHKRKFLLDPRNPMPYSKKSMIYEMNDASAFDIDTELDFQLVEFLVNKGVVKL